MIELEVVMAIIALIVPLVVMFFWSSFGNFMKLQSSNMLAADQANALNRMGQVLRSGTQITNAAANTLTIYAYFSPKDSTLSQVTYTYDATAGTLKAVKIPATGSPPNYTYNAANAITYTLLKGITLNRPLFT